MMDTPVVVPLAGWRDPVEILPMLSGATMPVLLHSGEAPRAGVEINRWSFLSAEPFQVVSWSLGQSGDPFRLLEEPVGSHASAPAGDIPFAGGAIGYIGYETGRAIETIAGTRASLDTAGPTGIPDLLFGLYAWAITWDHHLRRWTIVSTGLPESGRARAEKARADAETIRGKLEKWKPPPDVAPGAPLPVLSSSIPRERYLSIVEEAKRLIAAGEIYQVNLAQRLELPAPSDPMRMFLGIARHSRAPFSAYMDAGGFQIASASPERFVSLRGRAAQSRPIKGTRPRGRTPEEDDALARDLSASAKDRAENVMIVDLVRNDLGRVCAPGSVRAADLCRVESYASVHHLTSTITGDLAAGRSRADLLRALFPGGSMTGAPKVAAMQTIEDLEPVPRGIYSGALGYLSFCGGMDLSIVIRTAVVSGDRTWLSVGGGVVADSDPEAEWQESLDKASSVLKGMGATWPSAYRRRAGKANRRWER